MEKSRIVDATCWANEFSFAQIKRLAAYFEVYRVPKETLLFYEGDKNAYLVLIVKGDVHVVKCNSKNSLKHITTLGAGKTIGEMGIIDKQPRSASAITGTDAVLLVMTAERFYKLLQDWPRIGVILVLKIAKLMSQYLRQTSGRLIDNLNQ